MIQNTPLSEREAFKAAIDANVQLRASGVPGGGWLLVGIDNAFTDFLARRAPVAPAEPVADLRAALEKTLPFLETLHSLSSGREARAIVLKAIRETREALSTPAQPSTVSAVKTHRLGYDDHFNLTVPASVYQAMHRRAQQAESRAHRRDKAATWWMQSYFKAAAPPAPSPVTPCAGHKGEGIHLDPCCPSCPDAPPASPVTGALEVAVKKALRTLHNGDLHEITRVVDAQDILAAALAAQKAEEA